MILIVLAAICAATVPLSGGSLGLLANLRLRWLWVAPLALGLQVVIIVIAPSGHHALHAAVHIATYVMIGVFLVANRRIPGMVLIAAGASMNALAIVANGGVMPASARAMRIAGRVQGAGFHNAAPVAHPHLLWLGDLIPIPGPLPNVLSVGDCVIYVGMLVLLHRTCRASSRGARDTALPSSPAPAAAELPGT